MEKAGKRRIRMARRDTSARFVTRLISAAACVIVAAAGQVKAAWTDPPAGTVRICWIHHSCGSNLLHSTAANPSYGGNLGQTLNDNNYYVTECDYGWTYTGDPYGTIGDQTDTSDWSKWFNNTTMPHVYSNSSHYDWNNTIADPGGQNSIVMFKSCYPLSEVGGSIADEKSIYSNLLPYFAAHTNKLFVLVTPPGETVVSSWALTEELCGWLVNDWLDEYGGGAGYPHDNVVVFDFYGVLSETDAHHRISGGMLQHVGSPTADGVSPYHDGDDHPNSTGNLKATAEMVPLLNYFYNAWQGGGGPPIRINFQPSVAGIPLGWRRGRGQSYRHHGAVSFGWL